MSEGGIVNVIFVIFKVVAVLVMMVNGMGANYARNNAASKKLGKETGDINPIFRLFIYWSVLLVMLLMYEFTEKFKKIYFLYLMLIGAGLA